MNVQSEQQRREAEEARRLLAANPDLVFEERIRLTLEKADAEFWLKFALEWGGALYLLDETNKKRYEKGLIEHDAYEYARRTYRLGLITLSQLYDGLKEWEAAGHNPATYTYSMNSIDCSFIPAYLDDFSRVHAAGAESCARWIEAIRQQLSALGPSDEAARAIHTMVSEYITHIHLYAEGGKLQ
ncbi:hypothetical protein [Paenibacillus sp. YYML68]|uniref:hypothetical protein n=1 Tax=Paenibacillus sp. YYML68 TaxID=2909250 RepID=UPI0024903D48|nr:hypothetical protein [Paenibacillus sp. YYML68]